MKTRQSSIMRAWFFILIPLVVIGITLWQTWPDSKASVPTPQASATQKITQIPTEQVQITPTLASTAIETSLPILPTAPSPSTTPTPTKDLVRAHLSYYWPPFGDINCDVECEHIATGEDWHLWVGKGVACPIEYPLGTIFIVQGDTWQCIDRGEAIVVNPDGSIWLDFLNLGMPYPIAWGSVRTVEIRRPD